MLETAMAVAHMTAVAGKGGTKGVGSNHSQPRRIDRRQPISQRKGLIQPGNSWAGQRQSAILIPYPTLTIDHHHMIIPGDQPPRRRRALMQ